MLVEALKIMLFEDRQHDMQKAAAFVKRLATFSLCFGSAESMAGMLLFDNPCELVAKMVSPDFVSHLFACICNF